MHLRGKVFSRQTSISLVLGVAQCACALVQKHLCSTLDQQAIAAVSGQLDHDSHPLVGSIKREHVDNVGVCSLLVQRSHGEMFTRKLEERRLGAHAHEAIVTLERSGVVDDAALEESLDLWRQRGDELARRSRCRHGGGLFNVGARRLGTVVGFHGCSLAVDGSDLSLDAGLLAKCLGRSNIASHHRHDVLREGAGLVGADAGGVAHDLAGTNHAHQVLVLEHARSRKGQAQRDGQREPLGDRDHHDGDGQDERLEELHGVRGGGSIGAGDGDAEADEHDEEEDETGEGTQRDELPGQLSQFLLQRRLLDIGAQVHERPPKGRVGAHRDDEVVADSSVDRRTAEDEGIGCSDAVGHLFLRLWLWLVGLLGLPVGGDGRLVYQFRLAREGRLVHLDSRAIDEHAIDSHHVSRFDVHNVAHQEVVDGYVHRFAGSYDLDVALLLALVELCELAILVPVV